MQIVELGDCSMVIMKDSEDPPWVSVGDVYRKAKKWHNQIAVATPSMDCFIISSDFVYTAGRLVLFFKDDIKEFSLHDKVDLRITAVDYNLYNK